MMKVKSLLRRYVVYRGKQDGSASEQQEMIQIQDILVSRDRRVLVRDGRPLNITGTEYQIFMYLLDHVSLTWSMNEDFTALEQIHMRGSLLIGHGTEALRGRFGGQFPTVVDIGRENVCEPLLAASL